MKIRTDFVSNSSSSSWVLVGKIYKESALIKLLKNDKTLLDKVNESNRKYGIYVTQIEEALDSVGMQDLLEYLSEDFKSLEMYCDNGGDEIEYAIGLDPSRMSNNDTLGQFKQKVVDKLAKAGLKASVQQMTFITGGSDASGDDFFYDKG